MDIRDITEEVKYPGNKAFQRMFDLQKELIDHYVGIEGLPQYPIDVNTRSSQVLMKDFIGRIIEELGEAWESYEIMMDMKDRLSYNYGLIPHLQNFNEEVSDAIHFWLELMIFCGFEEDTLRKWGAYYMGDHISTGTLRAYVAIGGINLPFEHSKRYPAYWVIRDEDLKDEFLRGGRKLSKDIKAVMKQLLWDVTYHLQIARNTLKNKPWKQSEMMTDENLFEKEMMKATLAMFSFFYFAGFTAESLYYIYYKKCRVNLFRIRSKY